MSTESRDEAIRDAKHYVREVVRNDWSFEFSTKTGAPPPTYPASPEPKDVQEWRLREYDSSGSELEPQFSPLSPGSPNGFGASGLTSCLGTERRADRRRKRRRQLEEEMGWNGGLRTFIERRDAWTGAKSREQVDGTSEQKEQENDRQTPTQATPAAPTTSAAATTPSLTSDTEGLTLSSTGESSNLGSKTEAALNISERSAQPNGVEGQPPSSQHNADADGQSTADPAENNRKPSTETAITEPDTIPKLSSPSSSAATATRPSEDPLIPVVPSLIATSNPIRASITPAMYPSIYSKVVVQGLTPTVPINLADMTKAMVQGWKADGQWPPKPTAIVLPDDSIVRTTSITKHPDTPATLPGMPNPADKPPSSPESKRRSGIASTVRKVLHFSGFHPHPFHRRGSSSQNHAHPDDLAGEGASHGPVSNLEQQREK